MESADDIIRKYSLNPSARPKCALGPELLSFLERWERNIREDERQRAEARVRELAVDVPIDSDVYKAIRDTLK